MPVIFTYLHAGCPCDVTTFLDFTSFRLLSRRVGLGHGSKILTRFRDPSLVQIALRCSNLTKEAMFLSRFICWFVSLFVCLSAVLLTDEFA